MSNLLHEIFHHRRKAEEQFASGITETIQDVENGTPPRSSFGKSPYDISSVFSPQATLVGEASRRLWRESIEQTEQTLGQIFARQVSRVSDGVEYPKAYTFSDMNQYKLGGTEYPSGDCMGAIYREQAKLNFYQELYAADSSDEEYWRTKALEWEANPRRASFDFGEEM